jgi:hypothetical protein
MSRGRLPVDFYITSIYNRCMELPGLGKPLDKCDVVSGYLSCPDGHTKIPLKSSCQRVECPVCYHSWARKAGHRISERLRGLRSAYYHSRPREYQKLRSFRHFQFSPPQDLLPVDCTLDEAFALWRSFWQAEKPLYGGSVIFHPYRLTREAKRGLAAYVAARAEADDEGGALYEKGGFWALAREDVLGLGSFQAYYEWGPHYHVIGFGYVAEKSDDFEKRTGWVYTNLRDRNSTIGIDPRTGHIIDEVEATARYQLTHAGVERGASGKYRNSYRWFGICDNKHLRLVKNARGGHVIRRVVESVLICPVCGRALTFDTDRITGEVVLSDHDLELMDEYGMFSAMVRKKYRMFEVIDDV